MTVNVISRSGLSRPAVPAAKSSRRSTSCSSDPTPSCATGTMPSCARRWAMPRSRRPTGTAARSAKPTPSPWPRRDRARSRGCLRRQRSRRRPGDGRKFSRPAVGTRAGDRGAAGRRGDRRPDRRAAVPVGQHGQIVSGPDPGQDRRPAAARNWSATPSRPASKRRPFRLKTGSGLGATRLRTVNGPFGPHPARSMGPPGPCRQTPAGLTLGLLLRHLGGTTR